MLNLDRLRALHAISMHGSVNAAADTLHVTPSAISQQLAKLEGEIGQQLLERRGRGVRLTHAATLLVAHAHRVMSVLEQAEAELDAQRDAVAGQLTIAAFPTAARGLAPQAIARLLAKHPQLRITSREIEPREAIAMLVRRDLDLAIAQDWFDAPLTLPDRLMKAPLLDDIVDVALPKQHRLAHGPVVKLDDLAHDPWITWEAGPCHDWLLHTLRSRGHEPTIAHTAAEHATQLSFVAAGLGAAIMPRLGRDPVPRNVRVLPVIPTLHRHVYAIWRADATRRTAIRAAVQSFQHCAAEVVAATSAPPSQPDIATARRRSPRSSRSRTSRSGKRAA
jgi:DNA-binding transcriptional LysR family regulator